MEPVIHDYSGWIIVYVVGFIVTLLVEIFRNECDPYLDMIDDDQKYIGAFTIAAGWWVFWFFQTLSYLMKTDTPQKLKQKDDLYEKIKDTLVEAGESIQRPTRHHSQTFDGKGLDLSTNGKGINAEGGHDRSDKSSIDV